MIGELLTLSLVGLGFGALLSWASSRFAVQVDERVEEVKSMLPGANCGACGFRGCEDYAKALVANPKLIDRCRILTPSERKRLASYLGIETGEVEWTVAVPLCSGKSKRRFEYVGERSCLSASLLEEGPTACKYACLGFGDCERACPFEAIKMVDGLPQVDWEKCKGCGLCVQACPRGVMKLLPRNAAVVVRCNSPEIGKVVVTSCDNGCIKCRLCERNCPTGAIKVTDKVTIDYSICNACMKCVEACPRKIIQPLKG